jgi:hypothetical protein
MSPCLGGQGAARFCLPSEASASGTLGPLGVRQFQPRYASRREAAISRVTKQFDIREFQAGGFQDEQRQLTKGGKGFG